METRRATVTSSTVLEIAGGFNMPAHHEPMVSVLVQLSLSPTLSLAAFGQGRQ